MTIREVDTKQSGAHKDVCHNNAEPTNKQVFDRVNRAEKWMIILTAIIALTAIANAWIYCTASKNASRQTDKLIKKAEDIAKSFQDSVAQGESAIKIAEDRGKIFLQTGTDENKKSLEAYRKGIQLEQRPWVGISRINTQEGKEDTQYFSLKDVSVDITNSGRTPAINIRCQYFFIMRPFDEPIPGYEVESKRNQERIVSVIGALPTGIGTSVEFMPDMKPGRYFTDKSTFAFGRQDAKGKLLTLYILGKFTYSDTFEENPRHSTKICLMHTRGDTFLLCPEGNEMY